MLSYLKLLNYQGSIFLNDLYEPEENMLRVLVDKATTNKIFEEKKINNDVIEEIPIVIDTNTPILQIDFPTYISYSVNNEGYMADDRYESYYGYTFRMYTKSKFLDYVNSRLFAKSVFPDEEYIHYQIPCFNHIVDVVTFSEPIVSEIKRR